MSKIRGNFVLDGEICMMDENGNESFKDLMKQIKKKDHQIENPKYVMFDCLEIEEFDSEFGDVKLEQRYEALNDIPLEKCPTLDVLEQHSISNIEELTTMIDEAECWLRRKENQELIEV